MKHKPQSQESIQPDSAGTLFGPQSLIGSAGTQVIATSVGRGVGFFRGIVLTWLMTPAAFGALHVAMTVANVLMSLVSLGLSQGMMRYAPEHEAKGTLRGFVRSSMRIAFLVAGVLSLAILLLADWFAALIPGTEFQSVAMIRVVAGCAFSLAAFHIVMDLMKGLRMFRAVAVMDIASVVGFSLLAVATAWLWTDNAAIVLAGYGVSSLILAFWFAGGLKKSINAPGEANTRPVQVDAGMWRFSLWMMGTMLAWHALQQCGLWYLSWRDGSASAGAFYAARLFAQLVLWGGFALSSALSAHVTRAWETAGPDDALLRLETGTKFGCLMVLTGGVLLAIAGPWLLRVFKSEYSISHQTFNVLVTAFCYLAMFGFVQIRFSVEHRSHRSFWTCIGGLSVALMSAFVLTNLSNANVIHRAAWITLVGGMSAVALAMLVLVARGGKPTLVSIALTLSLVSIAIDQRLALSILLVWLVLSFTNRRVFTAPQRLILREWLTRR